MKAFDTYIGIDYSGAGKPSERTSGLQVYRATQATAPARQGSPRGDGTWNWNRKEIGEWLLEQLASAETPAIVGIDHAFSFPETYMLHYRLTTWDAFLAHMEKPWPTRTQKVSAVRAQGLSDWTSLDLRLTDRWTSSAKSVFRFDVEGTVANSTHAGIPWLHEIRKALPEVHFWPFDGFDVPAGRSVVAEVYPSIVSRRYPRRSDYKSNASSPHEHDAMAVCSWLRDCDAAGFLERYFAPPLTAAEVRVARLEGWILGVT